MNVEKIVICKMGKGLIFVKKLSNNFISEI